MDIFQETLKDVVAYLLGTSGYANVKAFLSQAVYAMTSQDGNLIATAYNIFKAAAIALMFFYFFVEIYDLLMKDRFSVETLTKSFVKMLLVFLVISNGVPLIRAILDFSNASVSSIGMTSVGTFTNPGMEEIVVYLNSLKGLYATGAIIRGIIPMLVMWISMGLLYFIAIGRTIELIARAILAPIALSNMYGEGVRNAGIMYLRKLAAVGLQGAVIIVIMFAGATVLRAYNSIPTDEDMNRNNAVYMTESGALMTGPKEAVGRIGVGGLRNLPSATVYKLATEDITPLYYWADQGVTSDLISPTKFITEGPLLKFIRKHIESDATKEQAKKAFVGEVLFVNLMDLRNIISFVLVQFACVGAALRSQQLANDLMGTN